MKSFAIPSFFRLFELLPAATDPSPMQPQRANLKRTCLWALRGAGL